MFYIQVVTDVDARIMYWSESGLTEMRSRATKFQTVEEVKSKRNQIASENPDWFVQWKRQMM